MPATHQYCTFYLGDQYFGLDVLKVQEIVRHQPLTRVPLAHPMIRGLINLRGQIVTAIDLRRRLDLPESTEDREPVNVVMHTDEGAVSLLVDEIGDVQEISEDLFERPPETLTGKIRELICGTYKLPHRLMLVLSTEELLNALGSQE
jgi:Chemotaxis signal transduction protein